MAARRWLVLLLALCAVAALPCAAEAKPGRAASAQAQKAARDAKKHERRGQLSAARDAWRRALEHDAKPAFRLSLARVEAELGHLLAAAEILEELVRDSRGGKKKQAQRALKSLEARIPTLRIVLPRDFDGSVVIDDRSLPAERHTEPLRLDPGEHLLRIEAPGWSAFEQDVRLEEGEHRELEPELERPERVVAGPVPGRPESRVATTESGTPATQVIGIASLVIGAAGVAIGTGFGLASMSTRDQLDQSCQNDVCTSDQREAYDRGRTQADIATAGFVVGGVGLGAGALFLLLSPSTNEREQPSARVRPLVGYRSVGARVSF